jgi:hypothetical protein
LDGSCISLLFIETSCALIILRVSRLSQNFSFGIGSIFFIPMGSYSIWAFFLFINKNWAASSNSKFNCSETEKRPEKYAGFPAGWKKWSPSSSLGLFPVP